MTKKITQIIPSIILYLSSALLAVFTIWSISNCNDVIKQAKEAGQLVGDGIEYSIVNFYMANCAQYFVFALLLAAIGLLLQRKQPDFSKLEDGVIQDQTVDAIDDADDESAGNDDEPGEWYDEEDEPETIEEKEKEEETE